MNTRTVQDAESPAKASSPAPEELDQLVEVETLHRLETGSMNVYDDVLERIESAMLATVLRETDHNLTHAARRLGISRPTLRSKLRARMPYT